MQLVEQRGEMRVAEAGAAGVAKQYDAVQAEVVEGVGQSGWTTEAAVPSNSTRSTVTSPRMVRLGRRRTCGVR